MVKNSVPSPAILMQATLKSRAACTRMTGLGCFNHINKKIKNNIFIYGMRKLNPDQHKKIQLVGSP